MRPKDASSAYLFFIRVTKLVYQIGLTTLFRFQGRENILASKQQQASSKQQASSSSKQQASSKQAATELISAYSHISINIDGTSPKLSWYMVLTKLTKGQGQWAKKSDKSQKSGKVKPGQGGGGTGVGDHFGTIRHISINIDGTSPKLLW